MSRDVVGEQQPARRCLLLVADGQRRAEVESAATEPRRERPAVVAVDDDRGEGPSAAQHECEPDDRARTEPERVHHEQHHARRTDGQRHADALHAGLDRHPLLHREHLEHGIDRAARRAVGQRDVDDPGRHDDREQRQRRRRRGRARRRASRPSAPSRPPGWRGGRGAARSATGATPATTTRNSQVDDVQHASEERRRSESARTRRRSGPQPGRTRGSRGPGCPSPTAPDRRRRAATNRVVRSDRSDRRGRSSAGRSTTVSSAGRRHEREPDEEGEHGARRRRHDDEVLGRARSGRGAARPRSHRS